jgi:hypothetical protein
MFKMVIWICWYVTKILLIESSFALEWIWTTIFSAPLVASNTCKDRETVVKRQAPPVTESRQYFQFGIVS